MKIQSSSAAFAGPERRSSDRVPIAVFGRCLLANQLEAPCQTIDISPNGIGIASEHAPRVRERVIVYLDDIGRVEGEVTRVFENGFGLSLIGSDRKRQKLASSIDWLKLRKVSSNETDRRHARIAPRNTNSKIKLADGSVVTLKIIDISLSGAALKTDAKPAVGSQVSLAGMQGRVVRHIEGGIAIEFARSLGEAKLKKRFG